MVLDKKQHWQSIYKENSSLGVSWYQESPKLSLQLIHSAGLGNDEAIIDIGGGASVLVDHLYHDGFTNLSVLDISRYALDSAKKRLGDVAKSVHWFEADIVEFSPLHWYSLWHDRAVFHFLTEKSDRRHYTKVLKQSLRIGGHLIIAAFAVGGPTRCSGLDIVQYDAAKLMAELGEEFELVEEINEVHTTPANVAQKFSYFHCVRISRDV